MRSLVCVLILIFVANFCYATHIVGGEVFYQYLGPTSDGSSTYKVSMRLFRDCEVDCGGSSQVACLPGETLISVYENGNGNRFINQLTLFAEDTVQLSLGPNDYPPCVTSRPPVCYEVHTYSTTVSLPDNDAGYLLAYENCCRATTVNVLSDNLYSSMHLPGVTYDCFIPGKSILPTGHNSTAVFNLKKPDLICYNNRFTLDYGATDPDAGDSVSFSFEPAFTSGATFPGASDGQPAAPPPYTTVTYNSGFSGTLPLGGKVNINPVTGQISGLSPAAGLYVVSVVVYEWRSGVNISRHRKDFILRIESCNIPAADLNASYITCNGYNLTFANESISANINSYYWNFGDASSLADTSAAPVATYTFPKAGVYTVTLITNRGGECSDTAVTQANVFPGFIPDFQVSGSCVQGAFIFTDKSTSQYGTVNGWRWNFGDPQSSADTSILQNPSPYHYSKTGTVTAQLIVSNSKGCIDTLSKNIEIKDKPLVTLPFRDTLICNVDQLQLSATSDAGLNYTWTPGINIRDANTATPVVNPQATTTYYVKVDDGKGCENTDSVLVNVADKVSLALPADTTICLNDTLQFNPVTNGTQFSWSPATDVSNNTIKQPFAEPKNTTTFRLVSAIGTCSAAADIIVHTAPYPTADAGLSQSVCFGATAMLTASYTGTNFTWSPNGTLLHGNTLTPVAGPQQTTIYTLTARDTSRGGCPKPVSDTVTVKVIPPVQVFAGRDTNIVFGQQLQLQASGATNYTWSPPTGLSSTTVANPVVTLPTEIQKITYLVRGSTPEDCSGTDSITVTQFKTMPEVFIPSGFTPDNDGLNDVLKPVVAGLKRFINFSVYNRLGQLVYSTSSIGEGWDGNFKGVHQPAGTYVYVASATDYLDRPLIRKGTVVLIR